jgi:hypothetical protein
MNSPDLEKRSRFPWGYAVAVFLPIVAFLGVLVLDVLKGPDYSMTPGMALVCSAGPYYSAIVAWGGWRLYRGDSRRYPALRWLVWVPLALGVFGVLWS